MEFPTLVCDLVEQSKHVKRTISTSIGRKLDMDSLKALGLLLHDCVLSIIKH